MQTVNVDAATRETGSKAARSIRREGRVPCILYSRHTEPVAFQMPSLQLKRLAFSRDTQRIEVSVDGEAWPCVLKDFDLHPITDEPIHADFQVLEEGEEIALTVPVQFIGTPVGQTEGGDTQYVLNQIDIACLPGAIPEHIEVNVEALDIGDSLHVYDLDVEGVRFRIRPEQTLVTVVAPFVEPVEEEEPVLTEEELLEEGELVETAEGEEGEEGEATEGLAPGQAPPEESDSDESFEDDL